MVAQGLAKDGRWWDHAAGPRPAWQLPTRVLGVLSLPRACPAAVHADMGDGAICLSCGFWSRVGCAPPPGRSCLLFVLRCGCSVLLPLHSAPCGPRTLLGDCLCVCVCARLWLVCVVVTVLTVRLYSSTVAVVRGGDAALAHQHAACWTARPPRIGCYIGLGEGVTYHTNHHTTEHTNETHDRTT